MNRNHSKTIRCSDCGKMFDPLGFPSHRAKHYREYRKRLLDRRLKEQKEQKENGQH